VSGIGEKLAENIVNRSENGPFENRKQLKSASLGRKAYQQELLLSISNAKNLWIILLCIQKRMELSKNGQRPKSNCE
jgi:transcriptional accessory protein Tex/SPT6